jgi:hypothetical protein
MFSEWVTDEQLKCLFLKGREENMTTGAVNKRKQQAPVNSEEQ